jgi:hypothetical protein
MNSRLFIKSSGLVGINNSYPAYQLDVNGTANVSGTLTSATHSNSGNLQTSYAQTATLSNTGNLSVGNTLTASVYSGMQRKVWNSQKQNTWGSGGSNFYLLGTFPAAGSGGNASSINITGTVGNWVYNQIAKIDLSIATRNGTGINGTGYGYLTTAQAGMDIVLYNSSNTSFQVFLATYGQFTAYDLEVLCPLSGFQTVLYEPTGTAYTSNLSTASNSSWVSGMSNLTQKIELATNTTTFSNTLAASVLQGSLNYTYLSNLPPLFSNSSLLGWSNIQNIPALLSNTSPQVLYGSNTASYASNALTSVASSANYVWASNALQSNQNAVSFASSAYVASNITLGSNSRQVVFTNPGSIEHNSNQVGYYSFGVNSGDIGDFAGMKVYISSNTADNPNGKSNQAHLTWHGWGNSVSFSRKNMRLTSDGTLFLWNGGIGTSTNRVPGGLWVNGIDTTSINVSGSTTTSTLSNSGNVSVGLGITANSLAVNDLFVNNTINAQTGISLGGNIISSSAGGNNIGTSGSPWGGLNTLTASLGDATTTNLSNSGVISLNFGDSDKIVLTSVGTNASKITHSSGWNVNYHSGYTIGTTGGHNFYTAYNGGWSNQMYINSSGVNIGSNLMCGYELQSSNSSGWGQLRLINGGNSILHRFDGFTYYTLITNNSNAGWNALRPISIPISTGYMGINNAAPAYNLDVGGTVNATVLRGSLDYNYLSNVPSLGTSAQSSFASNTSVWSSNNCVKGSSLSNASYPIMITTATPRLGLLWNSGTSGSLDFGFSTSAFQGSLGASARIRADDTNYSANLSFQTRTPGSDNSNMLTRMYIQSTGSIGIGNTSPGSLLDVSGNINCTSFTTNGTFTACNSTVSNLTVNGFV